MGFIFQEINHIGYIIFDDPDAKVNILNFSLIEQFSAIFDEVADKTDLQALIIKSSKKNCFVAGADIKEIERITDPQDGARKAKAGQDILNKIEDLKILTVVVVDGVALGGGCELMLACDYRVATFNEKVKIGLPEVKLGFIPGFGGTYRLPRLIGFSEALKMILSGKPVDASKALRLGLVDQLFTQINLEQQVLDFIEAINTGKGKRVKYSSRRKKKGFKGFLDDSLIGNAIVFNQAQKNVLKLTKGFYPAPLKALEVIKKSFYISDRQKGLDLEAQGFGALAVTGISKNLVSVFYLSEQYKKLKLDGADKIMPKAIQSSAIIGAGIMGGGIAYLLSSKGIWCRLKDLNLESIAKGYKAAAKVYGQAVKRRRLTKTEVQVSMARMTSTLDYSGFKNLDIVIEAVVEDIDVKRNVFKELSETAGPNTILATNTSALSVTAMAESANDPSKVIGFHFFNPVYRMPLVEVITTRHTSSETTATALNLVKRLGKTPILVKDSCGFIVNRILLSYMAEAGRILEECGQIEAIDKVMTDFGLPMGPFLLSDEVGLDVGVKVLHILTDHFGSRFKTVELFENVLDKQLLGKKSGKGFYLHGRKKQKINPQIAAFLPSPSRPFNNLECRQRLLLIMVNEAARCLQDGIVKEPGAIDIGMIFGTGFPPFLGGLLRYADSVGIDRIVTTLEGFGKTFETGRFVPCQYLLNLKVKGQKFYC